MISKSNSEMKGLDARLAKFTSGKRKEFESMLKELVEIPTVSAEANRKRDFQRAALLASEFLRKVGARVKIFKTRGNPIVLAEFAPPNAVQSVTVYNHLDVQPAQEPEWKDNPFRFTAKNGKYIGRGTTDDKGPALTVLLAAVFAQAERIPLRIQFLWEMEEEIGSPNFESFVRSHCRVLKSDSIVVVDSVWISPEKPTIYYALRGNITGSMFLETARTDVHSGVAGGIARNSVAELMDVAAKIQDAKTGNVRIPGFYKSVRRVKPEELRRFRQLDFDLPRWARAYGLKSWRVTDPIDALIRAWCRPTFEIHGMVGGYVGKGVKTAIAPRAELKWSARLVPDQDPEEVGNLIEQYVRRCNPDVKVRIHSKLLPYLGFSSGRHAAAAQNAIRQGFGRAAVFARAGGSDGAVAILQKHLKAPIVLLGLSLPEHGYHAPNENYDWTQASGGIKTFVYYFANLARLK